MEDFFLGDETHIEDAVKYGNEIKGVMRYWNHW